MLATVVAVGALVVWLVVRDRAPETAHSRAWAASKRATRVVGNHAAITAGETAPTRDGTLRLEGQVVDEQLQPVGGANVTLLLHEVRRATSERDGSFVFENLAAGPYRLSAHKDAHSSRHATVRLSETSEPVTLRLRPRATLVVKVIALEGGAPIPGATVTDRERVEVTGSDGIARLGGVPNYTHVDITAPGYAATSRWLHEQEDPEGTIEMTVTLARGALLAGTVIGPDGGPVAEATVLVYGAGSEWSGSARADAQGIWSIPVLAADRYVLTASSKAYAPAPPLAVKLDGRTPRTGVVVRVETGAQLVGTVVDLDGRPVVGANIQITGAQAEVLVVPSDAHGRFALLGAAAGPFWVSATTATQASPRMEVLLERDRRTEVQLVVADSTLAGVVVDTKGAPIPDAVVTARGTLMSRTTNARGAFDFGGVAPGTYDLVAAPAEQYDDRHLKGTKVAAPSRAVKLVVPDVSGITGRVLLDGKPMPYFGLIVTEYPDFSWQASPVAVRSPNGRFTRTGVAPGSWGVVVGAPGVARKVFENVVVTEGKVTDLGDITLDQGWQLRGTVTTPAGEPVEGATVTARELLWRPTETPLNRSMQGTVSAVTDARGAYRLVGLRPSEYGNRIVAIHPTLGSSGTLTLPSMEATLDLVIAPVGGIDGTIAGTSRRIYYVKATLLAGDQPVFDAEVDATYHFQLDDLVPGDYEVEIVAVPGSPTAPSIKVTVAANQRTPASLTVPSSTIALAVHHAPGCQVVTVSLQDERAAMSAIGMCDDKGSTVIGGLRPGRYRVCAEPQACATVTVTPAPAKQAVEIPALR